MPRNIYYDGEVKIQQKNGHLYLIEFTDSRGNRYRWTPRWADLNEIFLNALTVEGENRRWDSVELYDFLGTAQLARGILKANSDEIRCLLGE